ncbi:hypothetical protein TCAP_07331 [Tolypocladium capitatum]|uniref:Uncharacterized protein n=1 Tax=Tolypocladium capitatum TaxID=45235 RepID=A0A2K3PZD2_9HYPO|nr:hypothetical protein TCAP_07331 [Tolypocladium capitatum]
MSTCRRLGLMIYEPAVRSISPTHPSAETIDISPPIKDPRTRVSLEYHAAKLCVPLEAHSRPLNAPPPALSALTPRTRTITAFRSSLLVACAP